MVNKEDNDPWYESLSQRIDHYHALTQDDLKEIKDDLKEVRKTFTEDVVEIKKKQERCDSYWDMLGKVISLGGLGSIVTYLLSALFGKPHN